MTAVRTDTQLLAGMVALARAAAGVAASAEFALLSTRSGGVVIRLGDVVAKAHPAGTDPIALTARLRVAAAPELAGVLLAPAAPASPVAGRWVTLWPAGQPVAHDPDRAPWTAAAGLLAALHTPPLPPHAGLPAAGGPARVAHAVARAVAVGGPAAAAVRAAYAAVPSAVPGAPGLVHGDWHLGQLVRRDAGWRLVDVDDLGLGDPAWDLARPAALFAAGVLDPDAWHRFLAAYRGAGGPAVPPRGDPWPVLDGPARALAVQLAATGIHTAARERRALDDFEVALVDTCRRMVTAGGTADVS